MKVTFPIITYFLVKLLYLKESWLKNVNENFYWVVF